MLLVLEGAGAVDALLDDPVSLEVLNKGRPGYAANDLCCLRGGRRAGGTARDLGH
jgi:hypothetical protein